MNKISAITIVLLLAITTMANPNTKEHTIPLHDKGKLHLIFPTSWNIEVNEMPAPLPPMIVLVPKPEGEFQFLITPIWSPTGDKNFTSKESVLKLTTDELNRLLPGAKETEITPQEFSGTTGSGYYFLVSDKNPKPEEFPYAIKANLVLGDVLLHTTILSKSKSSTELKQAVNVLKTATLEK